MTTNQLGYVSGIIAALIWSGFILVSRLGGISELTPYDVIAVRYFTCAVLVTPIWWLYWRDKPFDKRLIFAGLIGGVIYAVFAFQGFSLAPASHAAALLPGTMPFFIILLALIVNKERASNQQWFGVGIITLGVTLLLTPLWITQAFTLGHAYFLAAAICWSLFSVLVKRWDISPWQVTISLAYVTCLVYLPIYVLFLPKAIGWGAWQSIAIQAFYQGVLASIVQVVFFVKAVQSIGPSSMGALMAMVPFISGISAIFIFDEPATISLVAGLILVSGGAWFAHSKLVAKRCFHGYKGKLYMPYVNIKITDEQVTSEQKAALIKGATQLLVDVLGKNPATTVVVIDEVNTDNWGIGGEVVTDLRAKKNR